MKLQLKDFQEVVVQDLTARAVQASGDAAKFGDHQALILSAPTGSGKTVIATALMERIFMGGEQTDPDPNATFLWLTDQPELNEQTRKKLLAGSDVFDESRLVTLEAATFDQPTFGSGKVYFLNTQKLGKNSSMVGLGDRRKNTLWQTIANTVADRPSSFWLIIDEAHRGMNRNANGKEARTLVQKLIKGASDVAVPPVPLILGISATPDRFNELLKGTSRTQRPCTVPVEAVRESGLLKDSITLFHTDEDQPSDLTLLAAAAKRLKDYERAWEEYSRAEKADEVRPVLVVQVADGTQKVLTRTPMDEVLKVLEKSLGTLDSAQVAHCFEDGTSVDIKGFGLPYVPPSDIQERPELRVVFFKMALTTGWDCPRAEVMMSFRVAKDETLIAQLVGRMVRTPLARRVSGGDLLNSVSLYLPYYDKAELEGVIEKLSQPDPDIGLPGTEVNIGNDLVELKRDSWLGKVFHAANGLPVYRVERVSKQSGARRVLRLGRRLSWDGIDKSALDSFKKALVATLEAERERLKSDTKFKLRFARAGRISVRSVKVAVGETEISDEQLFELPVLEGNIEDAFEEAGRKLTGGLHALYAESRAKSDGAAALPAIKRELFALIQDDAVLDAVEKRATKLCDKTLLIHQDAVNELPDDKRQEYRRIRRQASVPQHEPWELPPSILGPRSGAAWARHMYIKPKRAPYTCLLNEWESAVLKEELANKDVAAWLRNDPRKPWAFSIPYVLDGEDRPMYPDFLLFRRQGKKLVCDILEPHSLAWADSAAKAKGLAEYANKHGDSFGRIELIAKTTGKKFKRLALHDPATRNKVRAVQGNEHLKQLVEGL